MRRGAGLHLVHHWGECLALAAMQRDSQNSIKAAFPFLSLLNNLCLIHEQPHLLFLSAFSGFSSQICP